MKNSILLFLLISTVFLISCKDDDSFDPEAQLAADIIEIDNYLAANNIDAVEDPSGVRYVIQEMGNGRPINDSIQLLMDYTGTRLDDGIVFDELEAFWFALNQGVPDGWRIGLPNINEGGTITLYIPSGLAFGTIDLEVLPANSNVIYEITVTDSNIQLATEVEAIEAYLEENSLTAQVDPSGLRYIVHEQGDGFAPTSISTVEVNYTGKLLDETEFDAGEGVPFDLRATIMGWRFGIPLIQEGGSITLFIPSRLGFGPRDLEVIPPNSTLIFEVELLNVIP